MASDVSRKVAEVVRARCKSIIHQDYSKQFAEAKRVAAETSDSNREAKYRAYRQVLLAHPEIKARAKKEVHYELDYKPNPVGKHNGKRGWQANGGPHPTEGKQWDNALGKFVDIPWWNE